MNGAPVSDPAGAKGPKARQKIAQGKRDNIRAALGNWANRSAEPCMGDRMTNYTSGATSRPLAILLFWVPLRTQLFGSPNHTLDCVSFMRGGRPCRDQLWGDVQFLQPTEYRLQRAVLVSEEKATPNSLENPAEPHEHSFPFEVCLKPVWAVKLFTIALDCQAAPVPKHYEVDAVSTG